MKLKIRCTPIDGMMRYVIMSTRATTIVSPLVSIVLRRILSTRVEERWWSPRVALRR